MSLLDDAFEDYIMLDKVKTQDGYGGIVNEWREGVPIRGAMVFDNSIEARTAMVQGVTSVYTFTTKRNVSLEYNDVIKRVKDGKIFKITSDGDDKYTPQMATLDMRQVTAKEWELD